MTISLIAAVGTNWQIGLDGKLPWSHHKADMDWFRKITAGKALVAGHNTYISLIKMKWDLERSIIHADSFNGNPATRDYIIIGGADTYKKFAPVAGQLYLSRINYSGHADTYFPIAAFIPEQIQNAIWRQS